jgi:hypothetical protein
VLAIWSRLDNLAILFALSLYLLPSERKRLHAAVLLAPPLVAFGAYAAWNTAVGLPALPVSGTMKAGVELFRNLAIVSEALLEPAGISLGVNAATGWDLRAGYLGLLLVGCTLCFAIAAATTSVSFGAVSSARVFSRSLWSRIKVTAPPRATVWLPIVLFMAIRLTYYLACVRLSHQGFWYYTDIAIVLTAILLLSVSFPRGVGWALVACIVWAVTALPLAGDFVTFTDTHRWCPHVLRAEGKKLERCLAARNHTKLIDYSDGLFAFFLDVQAQSGTGLTANAEGHRLLAAAGRGAYHAMLIARGYSAAAWADTCYSGRIAPQLTSGPIACRQPGGVHLYGLALPAPKAKATQRRR